MKVAVKIWTGIRKTVKIKLPEEMKGLDCEKENAQFMIFYIKKRLTNLFIFETICAIYSPTSNPQRTLVL